MIIVLIAQRKEKLLKWILNKEYRDISSINVIKKDHVKVFLYIETKLTFHEIERLLKQSISSQSDIDYVYQFYPLWNGLIDYAPYLSEGKKLKHKYYQQTQKAITEEELKDFFENYWIGETKNFISS